MEELQISQEKQGSLISQIMKLTDMEIQMDENCILHQSISMLSDKWTLLILLALIQGTKRTSDLQRQIKDVSPKMLVQTLKKLEGYGLVERISYPEVPSRVEYKLTSTGWGLEDVLSVLYDWSVKRMNSNSLNSIENWRH